MLSSLADAGAVATILVLFVYVYQARLMRLTFLTSSRAFINVARLKSTPLREDANGPISHWRFTPQLSNAGNTPILKGLTTTYSRFTKDPLNDKDFTYASESIGGGPWISPISLGPHSELGGVSISVKISDLEEIGKRNKHLYIWGWIDYNDVFSGTPRHRTEFAYEVCVRADPCDENSDAFRTPHLWKHKGADQDCMRDPVSIKAGLDGQIGSIRRH